MQRQEKIKYYYNGKEVNKQVFDMLYPTSSKQGTNSIVGTMDYAFNGGFKSNRQVNERVKSVLETNKEISLSDLKQYAVNGSFNLDISDIQRIILSDSKEDVYKVLKSQKKEGEKHNKGKLPMSKLFVQFPDALQAVVLASCYGHHRYPKDVDWLNFKRVPGGSQTYKDACLRHSFGAEKDEESGLPEVFHQAWNKLAELQLWLEENNIDIKKFSKEYLDNLK